MPFGGREKGVNVKGKGRKMKKIEENSSGSNGWGRK
jgi:hypothetical protein